MKRNDLSFHIARDAGLEFVFTSGHALAYPMHTHVSVHTVTVIRKGAVCLKRGGAAQTYGPGSVYVVAPHEPHSPAYSDGFDIVSLCIDKEKFSCEPPEAIAHEFFSHAAPFLDRKALSFRDARLIATGIASIPDKHAGKVSAVIPDTLLETLRCSMSPYRFIRQVKKETGLTPHQYILQRRIRTAKKMLTASVPLPEVALLAGFCDQSHLNRWFKRLLGITPDAYRHSCRIIKGA